MARRLRSARGFTLIELMLVLLILGTLATLGAAGYSTLVERARIIQAIADIKAIAFALDNHHMVNKVYPVSLVAITIPNTDDPWGSPYVYFDLDGGKNKGGARKDKNLVPINIDYDLYSIGKDGATTLALTAKQSFDDIIRANNGGYVGLGASY